VAHLTLGYLLWRQGDRAGAQRAWRNAQALSAARPPDEPVPLGDGEPAGRLAEIAAFQLSMLETLGEVKS
jgi:chemotaxis protein methyltransferase CheR